MFGQVAPRYDLLNHLLSASLDRVWRRRAAASLTPRPEGPTLDLCCGTGDQALALANRDHEVVAADFCIPMLALAKDKYAAGNGEAPQGLAADALTLPFPSEIFSAATVSFGLRNVENLDAALGELRRVLRSGGELAVLEFALPTAPVIAPLYALYFRRVLPWIGRRISSSESAYDYLPSSVPDFPQRGEFTDRLVEAGFEQSSWHNLSGGVVCLYRAVAP
jgi:demethylmenaquinone methyltransferase/2-methoxy-6-polyprenyl-1,4-benzoquinol methylase